MNNYDHELYKQLKAERKQKRDELILKLAIVLIGIILIWLTINQ